MMPSRLIAVTHHRRHMPHNFLLSNMPNADPTTASTGQVADEAMMMDTSAVHNHADSNDRKQPPSDTAQHHEQEAIQPHSMQYHHAPPIYPPISLVSTCEEMNPQRRCSFEDCAVYAPANTWDAPDPNMAFLCICDGHGGRQMVEYLEDGLLFHVSAEMNAPDHDEAREGEGSSGPVSVLQRLERAFLMADIHSKALGVTTSGATVAVCLVTRSNDNEWTVYAANAGDARVVLCHHGKAHRMTHDHRTDDPEEVRRIERSGGFLFKGRVLGVLAVTRSLGDHCMKEYVIATPYTQETTIQKDAQDDESFVILACDGLWDVMSDQEAVDFVLQYKEEKERVARYLVKEALRKGSTDNITVSVAWL